MDNRLLGASRMTTLAVLVGVSLLLDGPWTSGPWAGTWPLPPAAAWDEWDRADQPAGQRHWGADQGPGPGDSLWDNLIGGAVAPGALATAPSWRADAVAAAPEPPQPAPTTPPPDLTALACNFSDWRPVASPWPDRLQQLAWDRVDVGQTAPPPSKPFRPSQPLVERPAPAPVRTPAPPCYASIQLPRPTSASRTTGAATYQLLYSPDPLPSTAWDAKTGTSRCLWTLVAPPGYNLSAAVSMGAWGSGRGALHLYAQSADGELQPVFSLRAPAQSSAEVHTHSAVAVLATALPPSAAFTLRVRVSAASAAASAELADTLQPPPGQQRPWAESWEGGLSPPPGSPAWRPKPYPYPASNVDAEAVDLTHQHQAANCEVEQHQQQRPPGAESTPASTTPPPRDEHPAPTPTAPPAEKPAPQRPAAGNDRPSTSTARPPGPTPTPPPPPPASSTPAATAAATTTAATPSRGPPPPKGTTGSATTAKPAPGPGPGPGQSSVNNKKP